MIPNGRQNISVKDIDIEKLQLFRSHGVTRDPRLMTRELDVLWYYQQFSLALITE